ncbi:MAG: OmpA family protein [Crocinitomicaceae bacterium]
MKYLVFLLSFNMYLLSAQDTLSLYYNIDAFQLSKVQKSEIQKKINERSIRHAEIMGYTDYLGSVEYNLALSKKRANTVKDFLQGLKVSVKECQGKGIFGATLDHSKGIRENRRVQIIFYRDQNEEIVEIQQSPDTLDLKVDEIKVGDKLVLKNFNFIPGRHFLVEQSKPEMDRLITILKNNPNLKIELQGHICCETDHDDGWDIDNSEYKLSFNRAKYIHDQLVIAGIAQDRLSYKGFGRTKPIYKLELSEAEKLANRRVEIQIIEK